MSYYGLLVKTPTRAAKDVAAHVGRLTNMHNLVVGQVTNNGEKKQIHPVVRWICF
jgi:hypothetical protein